MNVKDILKGYKKVGILPQATTQAQRDLLQVRSFAQAIIRKAGCTIKISDVGVWIGGKPGDWFPEWYVRDDDLDVAYQIAIEKISTGKGK